LTIPFDRDAALELFKIVEENPEIGIVYSNLNRWNDLLVDFLVQTGVLDAKMGQVWKDYADYVPFYLNLDGETTTAIGEIMRSQLDRPDDFQIINSIVGPTTHPRYFGRKGRETWVLKDASGNVVQSFETKQQAQERSVQMPDEGARYTVETETVSDLMDPIEAISKNTMAAIATGLANVASTRMLDVGEKLGQAKSGLKKPTAVSVTVRRNGKDEHWEVTDLLLHQALTGAFSGENPVLQALGGPVRLLREMVTRNPGYMGANMLRDSLMTWVLSGLKFQPFSQTLRNFGNEVSQWKRGTTSEAYRRMKLGAGVGGYEMARGKEGSRKLKHVFARGTGPNPNSMGRLFEWLWESSGDMSAISEMATRKIIYEDTYNRLKPEIGDRRAFGEGIRQAIEILDFNRRGDSPWAKFWMTTIPFLNSRLQGTDVMGRALTGSYSPQGLSREQVRRSFFLRGGSIALGTVFYTLWHYDDPDFEEAAKKGPAREDNWWFKIYGTDNWVTIPIPFEAGVVFKIIPEQLTRMVMGQQSRDTVNAARHAIMSVLNFNPVPHLARPALENWMNKSFFTNRPIVPHYLEDMGGLASRPSTGRFQKFIGESADISPLYIENIVRGYLGPIGAYSLQAMDTLMSLAPGEQAKPFPRITDVPFFDRFIQSGLGGGNKNAYYEWKNEVDRVAQTVNLLAKESPQEAREFIEENKELYRMGKLQNTLDKMMSKLRAQRNNLYKSGLGAVEMAERMRAIERKEADLLKDIESYRKMSDMPIQWLP